MYHSKLHRKILGLGVLMQCYAIASCDFIQTLEHTLASLLRANNLEFPDLSTSTLPLFPSPSPRIYCNIFYYRLNEFHSLVSLLRKKTFLFWVYYRSLILV